MEKRRKREYTKMIPAMEEEDMEDAFAFLAHDTPRTLLRFALPPRDWNFV